MSVIFEIHIGGNFGGEIEVNSDQLLFNACGIRWFDPWAYYWYNTNPGNQVNALPSSNNPSEAEISFTGPYSSCDGSYNFPPPLTQNGSAPFDLATTLVVQVGSMSDVKYLDSNGIELPTGSIGLPVQQICEEDPDFCGTDLAIELPNPFDDPKQKEITLMSALVYRKLEITRSAVQQLKGLSAFIEEAGIPRALKISFHHTLETASQHLRTASDLGNQIRRFLDQSSLHDGPSRYDRLETKVLHNALVGLQNDSIITRRIAHRLNELSGEFQRDVNGYLGSILTDGERSLVTLNEVQDRLDLTRNFLLPLNLLKEQETKQY